MTVLSLTKLYQRGTLPSGWYDFRLGVKQRGFFINKADAMKKSGLTSSPQYIQADTGTLFMGKLSKLTVLREVTFHE
ncbi:MAG: hypothetical protein IJ184_07345 [Alphaproteobacteria bacterium]|nr:hypothetical protein [Alphaproteobacteria bacterium]